MTPADLDNEADLATRPGITDATRHARNETADATYAACGFGVYEEICHNLLRPRFDLLTPDSTATALRELTSAAIDERTAP